MAPTDDEAALLPLDRSQFGALREHVEAPLYGGCCDCEVVMDVDPAAVFAPGDQGAAGPSRR